MFHEAITWRTNSLEIDDLKTAEKIINKLCFDWPQLRFQFAACYAMTDLLLNDRVFDKVRRKVFKQRLGSHCVYEVWLRIMEDRQELNRLFRDDRLFVDQLCVQVIHFAATNGFIELLKYFWHKLSPPQREAIGFLCWKKICFRANSPEVIKFVCRSLCNLNLQGMIRLTWDNFYFKVCQSLEVGLNFYHISTYKYLRMIEKRTLMPIRKICGNFKFYWKIGALVFETR
jgi:hypothetical protein